MPLDATQDAFARAVLNPEAPVPPGITSPTGDPAPKRFAVYRNNVTVSLTEALAAAFPTISKIVGDEFFTAMAREFIRTSPPSSPLLMFYGAEFSAFLKSFEPVGHLPYLSDVARLEQSRRMAYHAADSQPLAPDFLDTIAPEDLEATSFTFHPSVALVQSPYPILSIWEWNNHEDQKQISETSESVLVARPATVVMMRRLPAGGAQFLQALRGGAPFGEAAALAAGQTGFDLTHNIFALIESQIVTDFTINGKDQ